MTEHAPPENFSDVISSLGKPSEIASRLGVKEVTVRAWRVRGIPAEYWADIVILATSQGIDGVTEAHLARLAAAAAGREVRAAS